MKIVCDTNILISAFVFPGGPPDQVINLARLKEITLCLSPDILTEFRRVLTDKFKYTPEETADFLDRLTAIVRMVYPRERLNQIRRIDADNRILECVLEAEADFLITWDKRDLLPLKVIGKTRIVTAAEFLEFWKK